MTKQSRCNFARLWLAEGFTVKGNPLLSADFIVGDMTP